MEPYLIVVLCNRYIVHSTLTFLIFFLRSTFIFFPRSIRTCSFEKNYIYIKNEARSFYDYLRMEEKEGRDIKRRIIS